jgi:hypothetical protein
VKLLTEGGEAKAAFEPSNITLERKRRMFISLLRQLISNQILMTTLNFFLFLFINDSSINKSFVIPIKSWLLPPLPSGLGRRLQHLVRGVGGGHRKPLPKNAITQLRKSLFVVIA